jgi:hypothetical protein
MNSPKFFLFIFVFLFFLTILPSKNTVWGQPIIPGGSIVANYNTQTVRYTTNFNANGQGAVVILGKCNASTCRTVEDLKNCPSGWSKNPPRQNPNGTFTNDQWCRNSTQLNGSLNMQGLSNGKYVILINQVINNSTKCSGNPVCTINGGTTACDSDFKSCSNNDYVLFDHTNNGPTNTNIPPTLTFTPIPPTATPKPLSASINRARLDANNNATYDAIWNDDRGKKYIALTKCIGTTCNNSDSFARLANCPSPAQIGLTTSDIEVSNPTSKWCKYEITSHVSGIATQRKKTFTVNYSTFSNLLGPGKYIFAVNQEVDDNLKCSGNPACIVDNSGINSCGTPWSNCSRNDAVALDVAAPTATPITPTATPIPTGIITLNIASPPSGWRWETAVKKSDEEAPSTNTQWSNQGTASSASFQIIRNSIGGSPKEYWVRLKDVSGYDKSLSLGTTNFNNNPASVTLTTNGVNLTARYTAIPTPTATATAIPPTATAVPPTATAIPPTATAIPPTATAIPPTATAIPPTATAIPPTATPIPPTAIPTQTPIPTATPIPPTPTATPDECPNFAQGNATCDSGGIIDNNDYNCWKANFLTARSGATPTPSSVCLRVANFNYDNKVNLLDFAIWRIGYKSSISPTATTNP